MEIVTQRSAAEKRSDAKKPAANRQPRKRTDRFLPVLPTNLLETIYRRFDDLPQTREVGGYPAQTVAIAGYKFSTSGCGTPIEIPRGQTIVAVRSIAGSIVALHNGVNRWFTASALHFVNIKRAEFTGEIEVYRDTVSADVHALTYNVAAVGMNGLTVDDLQLAIGHLGGVRLDWRLAA